MMKFFNDIEDYITVIPAPFIYIPVIILMTIFVWLTKLERDNTELEIRILKLEIQNLKEEIK